MIKFLLLMNGAVDSAECCVKLHCQYWDMCYTRFCDSAFAILGREQMSIPVSMSGNRQWSELLHQAYGNDSTSWAKSVLNGIFRRGKIVLMDNVHSFFDIFEGCACKTFQGIPLPISLAQNLIFAFCVRSVIKSQMSQKRIGPDVDSAMLFSILTYKSYCLLLLCEHDYALLRFCTTGTVSDGLGHVLYNVKKVFDKDVHHKILEIFFLFTSSSKLYSYRHFLILTSQN